MTKTIHVYICNECGLEKSTEDMLSAFADVHPFKDWFSLEKISSHLFDKIDGQTSHEFCGKECLISFLNKLE